MALPSVALPTKTVNLPDGQTVEVHGLSRGQAFSLTGLDFDNDAFELETRLVAYGTDSTIEEVKAWYEVTASEVISPMVKAITDLSGLGDLGKEQSGD